MCGMRRTIVRTDSLKRVASSGGVCCSTFPRGYTRLTSGMRVPVKRNPPTNEEGSGRAPATLPVDGGSGGGALHDLARAQSMSMAAEDNEETSP